MKIAVSHWGNRISPVFDVAENLLLIDLKDEKVVRRRKIVLNRTDSLGRVEEIVRLKVELLICGAISYFLEKSLVQAGIRVMGFTCGDIDRIVAALQTGSFVDEHFSMPGYNQRAEKWGVRERITKKQHGAGAYPNRGYRGRGKKSRAGSQRQSIIKGRRSNRSP